MLEKFSYGEYVLAASTRSLYAWVFFRDVSFVTIELGRQQIPVLTGNPEKIILTY